MRAWDDRRRQRRCNAVRRLPRWTTGRGGQLRRLRTGDAGAGAATRAPSATIFRSESSAVCRYCETAFLTPLCCSVVTPPPPAVVEAGGQTGLIVAIVVIALVVIGAAVVVKARAKPPGLADAASKHANPLSGGAPTATKQQGEMDGSEGFAF